MSETNTATAPSVPDYPQTMGHPRPLWMLFMTEFWERFAFYGMRWALTLYIVAEFFKGDAAGQGFASRTYGAYLALVYAAAVFGGYVADRVLGYQRSILVGAVVMSAGLFMIMLPNEQIFLLGLSTVIVGNGLFKPNISSMVGQLYGVSDARRDRGFTLFYMGINAGALFSPLLTGWLASHFTDTPMEQNYKLVFLASGIGMLISLVWFWIGRRQLKGVGRPTADQANRMRVLYVLIGCVLAIPLVYLVMAKAGAIVLQWMLSALFVGLSLLLLVEGFREGKVQRDRVFAMLIIFVFNVLFWMFYEQAGSSFNFLAQNIVDREMFGGWEFPVGWFQSVAPLALVLLAPFVSLAWGWLDKRNIEPSIPRKFGLGLLGNAVAFIVLMYALSSLVDSRHLIPFWPLVLVYVLQTLGELCLSPIGLSMVTKLAPVRLVGFAMGGWFLSTGIGNNLSGIFAGHVSGETGMTVASALSGFTFSFWLLAGAGTLLFLIAPLINRLMHGVK
ncbi:MULTISPECIES: oligopeptide:H+ symporter [unclassified Dyella]|uniref:peptide MFS transporter n=1 Tax=unclassified Dyella TaxID=2634549 RepID=UPI000C8512FE|nr:MULTISPECIES: oligopeptide:H+ symporter [unclassified Dyella]MDR3444439.1 oligopeptide:H+ symporter [Dyella sp.]PMQ05978.1 Dipeptide and tripeptide permease B [Dyella sp. AD56]